MILLSIFAHRPFCYNPFTHRPAILSQYSRSLILLTFTNISIAFIILLSLLFLLYFYIFFPCSTHEVFCPPVFLSILVYSYFTALSLSITFSLFKSLLILSGVSIYSRHSFKIFFCRFCTSILTFSMSCYVLPNFLPKKNVQPFDYFLFRSRASHLKVKKCLE